VKQELLEEDLFVKIDYLHDLAQIDNYDLSHPDHQLIHHFIHKKLPRYESQEAVSQLTRTILENFYSPAELANPLLMPILRAAMPMWLEANPYFNYPESIFMHARKIKGLTTVTTYPTLTQNLNGNDIILLDTVAATGDTLAHVVQDLIKLYSNNIASIEIISCFASPQAVDKIEKLSIIKKFTAGFLMRGVDAEGYLIPKLGGDLGDILFGNSYY
jgi:uracil phosphoribosyltransferase